MLYPGEGEQKIHFACRQPLFISAQAANEVQLAFSFVKVMPCQLKTKLSVKAHCLYLDSVCAFVHMCMFKKMNLAKCILHRGEKTFCV